MSYYCPLCNLTFLGEYEDSNIKNTTASIPELICDGCNCMKHIPNEKTEKALKESLEEEKETIECFNSVEEFWDEMDIEIGRDEYQDKIVKNIRDKRKDLLKKLAQIGFYHLLWDKEWDDLLEGVDIEEE